MKKDFQCDQIMNLRSVRGADVAVGVQEAQSALVPAFEVVDVLFNGYAGHVQPVWGALKRADREIHGFSKGFGLGV
jgi:hypothetical protein